MFGIGKLIGGALNAVGLGKLAPFVSMAINLATGNIAGLATDVMGLMSNIKGLGFLNKVAQFAPLGGFSSGGAGGFMGGIGNLLSSGRLGDLASKLTKLGEAFKTVSEGFKKIEDAFKIFEDVVNNRAVIEQGRRGADMGTLIA